MKRLFNIYIQVGEKKVTFKHIDGMAFILILNKLGLSTNTANKPVNVLSIIFYDKGKPREYGIPTLDLILHPEEESEVDDLVNTYKSDLKEALENETKANAAKFDYSTLNINVSLLRYSEKEDKYGPIAAPIDYSQWIREHRKANCSLLLSMVTGGIMGTNNFLQENGIDKDYVPLDPSSITPISFDSFICFDRKSNTSLSVSFVGINPFINVLDIMKDEIFQKDYFDIVNHVMGQTKSSNSTLN